MAQAKPALPPRFPSKPGDEKTESAEGSAFGTFYFDRFAERRLKPMSDKKNKAKYWLSLSGIALQMGVIIFLGAKAGQWLDAKYEGGNTYTVVLTLFSVAVSMYLVVKQTNKLNS